MAWMEQLHFYTIKVQLTEGIIIGDQTGIGNFLYHWGAIDGPMYCFPLRSNISFLYHWGANWRNAGKVIQEDPTDFLYHWGAIDGFQNVRQGWQGNSFLYHWGAIDGKAFLFPEEVHFNFLYHWGAIDGPLIRPLRNYDSPFLYHWGAIDGQEQRFDNEITLPFYTTEVQLTDSVSQAHYIILSPFYTTEVQLTVGLFGFYDYGSLLSIPLRCNWRFVTSHSCLYDSDFLYHWGAIDGLS